MLTALELENLQSKRTCKRLIFLFEGFEGMVPAINPDKCLVPRRFEDHECTHIVNTTHLKRASGVSNYKPGTFDSHFQHWVDETSTSSGLVDVSSLRVTQPQ